MFAHDCSSCGKRQLVFVSQVTSLVNTDHGIELRFRCWCGAEQLVVTGKAVTEAAPVGAAA